MRSPYLEFGFLPPQDPLQHFAYDTPLHALDELGRDLPSLLEDDGCRAYLASRTIPAAPAEWTAPRNRPELQLYYVRLGFLVSAYVNQVGHDRASRVPANLAVPLCDVCRRINRPPILSYDGYALYNWKRFDPSGPIALGNIDTIQNFVHLYDEHWFILVHVEIEHLAAGVLAAIERAGRALRAGDAVELNAALAAMATNVWLQVGVLRRIPEKMDPALYFRTFRPYIRFFENVVYEGVDQRPMNYRGETGAQSSIVPALVEFLKIPHQQSLLTDHLADMRRFMPSEHRELLAEIAALPAPKPLAEKETFNDLLEAIATFREVHYGWANEYIHKRTEDPRGTGGTPYMQWLKQLMDETRAFKIP